MSKLKIETNIDRLKICYKQDENIWDWLCSQIDTENTSTPQLIDCFDYRLVVVSFEKDKEDKITHITAGVDVYIDEEYKRLGYFDFSNNGKYAGYCFFEMENKALYTEFVKYPEKHNLMGLIAGIADDLGLEYNNITSTEIALDLNENIIKHIRKFVKSYEQMDMFVNGNLVKNPNRKIDNYIECYGRSRMKLERTPTLYFSQKNDNGISLKIYDKGKEIKEESGKEYIREWLGFKPKEAVYRLEVTIKNNDIRAFCEQTGHEYGEALYLLDSEAWRGSLWLNSANRLIRFRDRQTGEDLDLLDLLGYE